MTIIKFLIFYTLLPFFTVYHWATRKREREEYEYDEFKQPRA